MMSNSKPTISIVASAIKPHKWKLLYEQFTNENEVDFEIVFVGPKKPDFTLPDNLIHIQTDVKPAQATEIAYRNSKGNFFMHIGDDCIFKPYHLDRLMEEYEAGYNNQKVMIGAVPTYGQRVGTDGIPSYDNWDSGLDWNAWLRYPDYGIVGSPPQLTFCPIIRRDLKEEIGGYDTGFIAVDYDIDEQMRLYEIGGSCIHIMTQVSEDLNDSKLFRDYNTRDRQYLHSLWVSNGTLRTKRAVPVKPYVDKDILIHSQGNKGEWN